MPTLTSSSPPANAASARRGAIAAFSAYFLWGTLPVYWKMLDAVPVLELMAHRIVWTLVAVLIFQVLRGRLAGLKSTWESSANRRAHLRGGVMLTVNWGVFVWALLNERVIEASLGYFLVPLVNAGLGRLIFGERLKTLHKAALALAALGVATLFAQIEDPPWVALSIAGSWSTYGVIRKQSNASAINGLALELSYMSPLALAYLAWIAIHGEATFGHLTSRIDLTIIGTGFISMVPLVLFAYSTQRLTFTTLGLLQYAAPTFQFLIGWLVFGEPFTGVRVMGFTLIWIGLACYVVANLRSRTTVA